MLENSIVLPIGEELNSNLNYCSKNELSLRFDLEIRIDRQDQSFRTSFYKMSKAK